MLISCRNLSYKTQKINNDIMGINIAKMKIERENLQHADDVTLVLKDKAIEAVNSLCNHAGSKLTLTQCTFLRKLKDKYCNVGGIHVKMML